MIKRIISAVIVSFLFCTSLYALGYNAEIKLMDNMTVIMETYNEQVGAATSSKDFIKANNEFAEQISALAPKMIAMSEKHPEWGSNPPEEISISLQRYAQAAAVAFGQSLQQTIMFANEHPDDTALQESLMNITQAFGTMQEQ